MKPLLECGCRRMLLEGPTTPAEAALLAVLAPLGRIYGGLMALRRWVYAQGLLPQVTPSVPLISVGNLLAGGTGKTPLVSYLVDLLQRHGYRVAVLSRGYGASGLRRDSVRLVCAGNGPLLTAEQAGDEPYLLARRHPAAVVVSAPRRSAGLRCALAQGPIDLVLLDDGFQHLALRRDFDLVLLDARRPLATGRVLPAGLLREAPAALRHADLLLLTRCPLPLPPPLALLPERPQVRFGQQLASHMQDLAGACRPLHDCRGGRVVAFAGIAAPEDFFAALRQQGIVPAATLALADHSRYDRAQLERIQALAAGADWLLTTEKDAVKLRATDFDRPCYAVPLELVCYDEALLAAPLLTLAEAGRHPTGC
ncbi:tetraacyldisaccharide 4'-kinase [Desulfuromonas thiophila]|uniref:tetraacyldisaccharide 4'-kinase n=1 Tax=Desulfuromonas thiophila TaxID=57664 RepID=UPI0029F502AE|nr:tetraacyldisaccharide 4'-kinase [Desulfuromonas thiophila]